MTRAPLPFMADSTSLSVAMVVGGARGLHGLDGDVGGGGGEGGEDSAAVNEVGTRANAGDARVEPGLKRSRPSITCSNEKTTVDSGWAAALEPYQLRTLAERGGFEPPVEF